MRVRAKALHDPWARSSKNYGRAASPDRWWRRANGEAGAGSSPVASLRIQFPTRPRSSSGSGHFVLTEERRVRLPYGVPTLFGGVGQQEAPLVGSEAPVKRRGGASPLASARRGRLMVSHHGANVAPARACRFESCPLR